MVTAKSANIDRNNSKSRGSAGQTAGPSKLADPRVEARKDLGAEIDANLETVEARVARLRWDRESLDDLLSRTRGLIVAYNALAEVSGADNYGHSPDEFIPNDIFAFLGKSPDGDVLISREKLANLEKQASMASQSILTPSSVGIAKLPEPYYISFGDKVGGVVTETETGEPLNVHVGTAPSSPTNAGNPYCFPQVIPPATAAAFISSKPR
jgi:hypothetical protein